MKLWLSPGKQGRFSPLQGMCRGGNSAGKMVSVEPRMQKPPYLLCDFRSQPGSLKLRPSVLSRRAIVLPQEHYLSLLMSLCKTQILKQLGSEQLNEFNLLWNLLPLWGPYAGWRHWTRCWQVSYCEEFVSFFIYLPWVSSVVLGLFLSD